MKLGADVGGYEIVTKPTNAGAGKCLWAFATKDGAEYFIKEFLELKRPRPDGPGTPEQKKVMLAQCEEFELRHRTIMDRIDPMAPDAGNLVVARDFFCEGTRYYKVTERLHPAELVAPHELPPRQMRVLLLTLAASLQFLHRIGIVHGDLKPDNILLHNPSARGLYTAKLIDFDDAYLAGAPPARDVIGGDHVHGAPEWIRYLHDGGVGPERLTTAVDVFAFALVVHTYLTGALPVHDGSFTSTAEAVNTGVTPVLDERLAPATSALLRRALSADPAVRPAMAEMREVLDDEAALRLTVPRAGGSRLRSSFGSRPPVAAETSRATTRHADRGSRLRINLTGRPGGTD